ncbi:MAG: glucosamine--fructose-6-phosphate aminotransferase [Candidatus Tokpelaia sp. JSC161]|jgi:glucosamine--fructose-6-phosphate aminotransferase (isomerizing)|nr:MAG: glucosamine--fructose-6-phosphate aminotransferase [Candidatus Tokpelaia sp. JSC161]
MCGIIGILGKRPVALLLLDALKRLEYRGYDSAGIATLENGKLTSIRAEGKLIVLEEKLRSNPLYGTIGIGHTRWATHGVPIERNAHPHTTEKLSIVHNGIIENFFRLRTALESKGYIFHTETDTEIIACLITDALYAGKTPFEAVQLSLSHLEGTFAFSLLFEGIEDCLIAVRRGSPLVLGYGEGEMYLASDGMALAPLTNRITYLEDGDLAILTHKSVTIFDKSFQPVIREEKRLSPSLVLVSKGNYRHFMHKEIYEQPESIAHTLSRYLDVSNDTLACEEGQLDWSRVRYLFFSACGTAYYSTLVAKYWFESLAGLLVENDVASEFRYREPPLRGDDTLALFVSQSGETADTLASLHYCKKKGIKTGAVVNVIESSLAHEADLIFPILAGLEIGVASTKTFTSQLTALVSLALFSAKMRGMIDKKQEQAFVRILRETPRYIRNILKMELSIKEVCRELTGARHVLYIGRGTSYPIALEGALKLKEVSYIHAEGYAAGELKHGPIALINDSIPIIVIAPYDRWFGKIFSNVQEVATRGGRIILITDKRGAESINLRTQATLIMPEVPEILAPILYAVPVQLIAYHTAVFLGTDVDQPRNLAKSVTVE